MCYFLWSWYPREFIFVMYLFMFRFFSCRFYEFFVQWCSFVILAWTKASVLCTFPPKGAFLLDRQYLFLGKCLLPFLYFLYKLQLCLFMLNFSNPSSVVTLVILLVFFFFTYRMSTPESTGRWPRQSHILILNCRKQTRYTSIYINTIRGVNNFI